MRFHAKGTPWITGASVLVVEVRDPEVIAASLKWLRESRYDELADGLEVGAVIGVGSNVWAVYSPEVPGAFTLWEAKPGPKFAGLYRVEPWERAGMSREEYEAAMEEAGRE